MKKLNKEYTGFKRTPMGWIPKDWKTGHLSEFCNKITDGTHGTPVVLERGRPYLTAVHVKDGMIDYSNCYYLSEKDHNEIYQRCNPERGDVLMVNIGAGVASTALVDVDFQFSLKNVALLKPNKEKLDGKYLELFQQHIKPRLLVELINGGAQPFLGLQDIRRLPFYCPDLEEQARITNIIKTWDSGIFKTRQLIIQLEKRNRVLTHTLLTTKNHWKDVKLIDIFDRVTDKNVLNNTNVVTISAQKGFVRQEEFFSKRIASEILDNYCLIQKGDFCYNKSYSKGYDWGTVKRLNDFDHAVVTTLYICFRLKQNPEFLSDYFELFFNANLLDKSLSKIAHEGGRAHGLLNVTPSDFFSIKIKVPPLKEQQEIVKVLNAAKKELNIYERKLENLKIQKKGLMQKLLTGEVRVKV